jgi:hypothetical protein
MRAKTLSIVVPAERATDSLVQHVRKRESRDRASVMLFCQEVKVQPM